MPADDLAYQIAQHARSLTRWFSEKDAKEQATRRVLAGKCWRWPTPPPEPGTQFRLFE
jgi:hypothetical protein